MTGGEELGKERLTSDLPAEESESKNDRNILERRNTVSASEMQRVECVPIGTTNTYAQITVYIVDPNSQKISHSLAQRCSLGLHYKQEDSVVTTMQSKKFQMIYHLDISKFELRNTDHQQREALASVVLLEQKVTKLRHQSFLIQVSGNI